MNLERFLVAAAAERRLPTEATYRQAERLKRRRRTKLANG